MTMSMPESDPCSNAGKMPPPPEEQLINFEQLKTSCGEDGAHELLGIFLDSTNNLFDRMESALAAKDAKQLKNLAHEMKGACASVGSVDMAAFSKSLEQAAMTDNWSESRRLVQTLKELFARVQAKCESIMESRNSV